MRTPRRPPRDPDAYPNERPAHRVRLPRAFIARYPVTVAQWRVYHDAADSRTKNKLDPQSLDGIVNHPAVRVSWHDALGYCRWLTRELRASTRTPEPLATLLRRGDGTSPPWVVTLPSEAEWEKAARGADGRRYPWGDQCDANRANAWETGIEAVSAVGCFKRGLSPAGTEEQSGHVYEWTRSLWGRDWETPEFGYPYTYDSQPEREDLAAPDDIFRVVRGGSFGGLPYMLRSADRGWAHPVSRGGGLGFRVVVSPFVNPLIL